MSTGRWRRGKMPPLKMKRSPISVVVGGGWSVVVCCGWPVSEARARSSCLFCGAVWVLFFGCVRSVD